MVNKRSGDRMGAKIEKAPKRIFDGLGGWTMMQRCQKSLPPKIEPLLPKYGHFLGLFPVDLRTALAPPRGVLAQPELLPAAGLPEASQAG